MKKIQNILIGILLSFSMTGTAFAAGTAPSTYNSDARALLEMLWAKLDEAIVSNYNVSMLLRYHDHAGTNPGDFVTRGLPIGSGGIASGAVTATKMSTAARTRVASAMMGDLSAGGGFIDQKPIFVASGSGTVTGLTYTNGSAISTNPTNYTQLSVFRWRSGSFVPIYRLYTLSTAFQSNYVPVRITSGLSDTSFQVGDSFTLFKYDYGAGQAVDDLLVTIEYTVSE